MRQTHNYSLLDSWALETGYKVERVAATATATLRKFASTGSIIILCASSRSIVLVPQPVRTNWSVSEIIMASARV